jgi:small subunit ribosomal protein S4
MARYIGPRCRLSRREGVNLDLKKKWALERRESPPGQHGAKRTKLSNFGLQLREKQKAKRFYGVLEKQFRSYYLEASRRKGITGVLLLQQLECRLDNVIYQLGFAVTRAQARQIVGHGLIRVNGKRVNIPSYQVKANDVITVEDKEKSRKFVKSNVTMNEGWTTPLWLVADPDNLTGKVVRSPEREDIKAPVNEQLIVELYSR